VANNGVITIDNGATIADPSSITPTRLTINAQQIDMHGGFITAASGGNIGAGAVDINYVKALRMDNAAGAGPSKISTTAIEGDGGPITINGQGALLLERSSIVTSVTGTSTGNGGDININVPYIVLDTGAILAGTTATSFTPKGGAINLGAKAIIPSFESVVLGGKGLVRFDPQSLGLNTIQSAAPATGAEPGKITAASPTLDLGASLVGLTGRPATPTPLGRSLCTSKQGSSLATAGRGGLPPSAGDPLWVDADQTDDTTTTTSPSSSAPAEPARHSSADTSTACR
jgi:hypothetical protein